MGKSCVTIRSSQESLSLSPSNPVCKTRSTLHILAVPSLKKSFSTAGSMMNFTARCVPHFGKMKQVLCSMTVLPRSYSSGKNGVYALLQNNTINYKFSSPVVSSCRSASSASSEGFPVMNIQDEEDFKKRVMESDIPVVVDFHANWCGPCKLLAPRLESIMAAEKGKVALAKVDIDDNGELAMDFGVQAVPTVIAVKNGKIQDKFMGLIDDDQIKAFVEKLSM